MTPRLPVQLPAMVAALVLAFASAAAAKNRVPEPLTLALGGRLQAEVFAVDPGNADFGSGVARIDRNGAYLRRLYLHAEGRLGSFDYYVDSDFTDPERLDSGLRYAILIHSLGHGGTLELGQRKPWRSFDELASNNDLPFVERNVISANGIDDADYTQGLFYQHVQRGALRRGDNLWWGAAAYSLTSKRSPADHCAFLPRRQAGAGALFDRIDRSEMRESHIFFLCHIQLICIFYSCNEAAICAPSKPRYSATT